MDQAYKQHSNPARRKNRSSTNLNHLSLAPLTSKMPLTDHDDLPDSVTSPVYHTPSYLQGKSAPTTPRLLSRSAAHTRSNSPRRAAASSGLTGSGSSDTVALPKSKSASHLYQPAQRSKSRKPTSGTVTPGGPASRRRKPGFHDDNNNSDGSRAALDRTDSDWLLRTGALIGNETREFKGQSWLVSRASNTSLTGIRDAEEEMYERELARERELASRQGSRRGSFTLPGMDEDMVSPGSRYGGSRSHSRMGSRSALAKTPLRTPLRTPHHERHGDSEYFNNQGLAADEYGAGPDFVGLDEKLEAAMHREAEELDEETVRRLVKRDSGAKASWMGNLIGWSLFSVEENEEESSDDDDDEEDLTDGESDALARTTSTRSLSEGALARESGIPPPKANEGGWQDAAWLLSVATKVLL
ncbi:uncharacterized protein B0I36DRAFT_10779 [Microdochium trichocladiopsis]|uniref:Uncharacterized protein n=1 Tax=Microdochium trichocladiopsis TaxID=1682393 RepID=A0A9P9BTY3_9PEZI|nr:uncharacterized protein B0I36DRAFT_10779 [Microdochium trichocladiopsis]KAH7040466.1 hypothetical protein B0I36DRAFT_10779 [Microdochium trichocladiopsis]